jgi:ubiquinone/menaquinone biosynthesis C-methylase UbiE
MKLSLFKQGLEFYRWSARNPVGTIPSGVAKEGAGENRIPFMHLGNSVPVYLVFCDMLKNSNKTQASVLDIGCGTGRNISFVKDLIKKSYEFFGIDYSSSCISYAKSQYKKHGVIFVQHDGKLPFPSNIRFYRVSHVLEHIAKKMLSICS